MSTLYQKQNIKQKKYNEAKKSQNNDTTILNKTLFAPPNPQKKQKEKIKFL